MDQIARINAHVDEVRVAQLALVEIVKEDDLELIVGVVDLIKANVRAAREGLAKERGALEDLTIAAFAFILHVNAEAMLDATIAVCDHMLAEFAQGDRIGEQFVASLQSGEAPS